MLTVEVKCPKTCENGPIADVDYLKNGHEPELNGSRRAKEIYTQMQYQMYFCKVKRGVLFVFTSMDQRKIPISLNLDFIQRTMTKLAKTYVQLLPRLVDEMKPENPEIKSDPKS